MNNIASTYINNLMLEVSLDPRIETGVLDINDFTHREVMAEYMYDHGIGDVSLIVEILNKVAIRDGKYPDRQAYNKDGWLVTFPSKEYKDAAIQKGTHYASDPTHGKGGMNLYYKKKGKQKRTTQQQASQTDPNAPVAPPAPPKAPEADPAGQAATDAPPEDKPAPDASGASSLPPSGDGTAPATDVPPAEEPTTDAAPIAPTGGGAVPSTGTATPPSGAPPTPAPAPLPPAVQPKVDVTIKFAKSKGWTSTPYGEWRNSAGEVTAVESLSKEVAPIKAPDREELQLFADKQAPDA